MDDADTAHHETDSSIDEVDDEEYRPLTEEEMEAELDSLEFADDDDTDQTPPRP